MALKKSSKNNPSPSLADKLWDQCIGCKYNTGRKDVEDPRYFQCSADINEFPCERIPILYPHKLFDKLQDNLDDGKVIRDQDGSILFPFIVELYDKINDNLIKLLVISNDKNKISEYFSELLKKHRVYRHLSLNQIIDHNDFFKNHSVLVVPNEVNRVVFPEAYIEMEAYGQKIELEEVVYDFVRYPGVDEESAKHPNLSVNERLSAKKDVGKSRKTTATKK